MEKHILLKCMDLVSPNGDSKAMILLTVLGMLVLLLR